MGTPAYMSPEQAAGKLTQLVVFLREGSSERAYPTRLRITTGQEGGEYYEFGEMYRLQLEKNLSLPVDVQESSGSVENAQRLQDDESEVALLQFDAVMPDHVAVVTPLYQEYLYFIVRSDGDLTEVGQFGGKTVVVGEEGSGMQLSSGQVLQNLKLDATPIERTCTRLSPK